MKFYILNPVGITTRTARWLFINCLAVLLFVSLPKGANLFHNNFGGKEGKL